MKKIVSLLLAMVLILSCTGAFAQTFSDIEGHWAQAEILKAYEDKIISGDGDGNFRPNANISRAEFMKMITVMLSETFEEPVPEMENTKHWAEKYYNFATQTYLSTANENSYDGVRPGAMSDENYDLPIKRWEMAYIIDNAFVNVFGVRLNQATVNDIAEIEKTYDAEITAGIISLVEMEIIKGDENGNFNASNSGTRAEAVTLVNRTKKLIDEVIAYHEANMTAQKEA